MRALIRRSVLIQIGVGVLIAAVVLVALVRSLELVSEQERETRAIREMRDASVALLVSTGSISASIDQEHSSAPSQYRKAIDNFDRRFGSAAEELKGGEAAVAVAIEQAVRKWEATIVADVTEAVEAGDYGRAQAILNSPENGEANSRIGLLITTLLNNKVADQLQQERETKDIALYVALAVILAIVTMTGVAAFFLIRIRQRVVPPLEDLDVAATRIGAGELDARARPAGTSETVRAGTSFNAMAERVERNIDELRAVDLLKDEFVATVSHELRTPITTARAYLDMYLDGEVGPLSGDQRSALGVISRSVDELADLIDDLLTLTNIEARGERSIHLEPVDLKRLVADVESEQRPLFESAGVDLRIQCDAPVEVVADPLRVRQVMVNLLSNARKFSPGGAIVSVTVGTSDGRAQVKVADQGIGIAPEDLPRIGERFYRAGSASDVPGTGLGMAIVYELVELHGGEVSIESEPQVGSQISFTLPLAA